MSGHRVSVAMPPVWEREVQAWELWARAAGHSAGTIRLRRCYLGILARSCPDPWAVSVDDLAGVVASVGEAPETRKSARAAYRAFYGWAVAVGRVVVDPAAALPSVRVPEGRPRPAPSEVIEAAMARATARELLMLDLAFLAGLRRAEIARVHTRDVVEGRLRVAGKGGKVRVLPLHPRLVAQLAGVAEGWVFPAVDQWGNPLPGREHLSPGAVGVILSRLLGDGWTAHTLRHAAATRWYAAQRDLFACQRLLGHSKPETTARYVALPDDALVAAVMAPVVGGAW